MRSTDVDGSCASDPADNPAVDPDAIGLNGAVAAVTGGASGIGAALGARFAAAGAAAVILLDVDRDRVTRTADRISELVGRSSRVDGVPARVVGMVLDVGDEAAVRRAIDQIETDIGPVDVWCSNAGIAVGEDLGDDGDWERSWRVHVQAQIYAARHVLPRMAARGRGRFMVTASAAGLLTEVDCAPYAVTKHAAVALAEWLSIRYGGTGVGVSCLCPQAVRTPMTDALAANSATLAAGELIDAEQVVDTVLEAFADNRFLILPHPRVAEYERRRSQDRDRWLAGMRRFRSMLDSAREE